MERKGGSGWKESSIVKILNIYVQAKISIEASHNKSKKVSIAEIREKRACKLGWKQKLCSFRDTI